MSLAEERVSEWASKNEKDRGRGERGESAEKEASVERRSGGQQIRPEREGRR